MRSAVLDLLASFVARPAVMVGTWAPQPDPSPAGSCFMCHPTRAFLSPPFSLRQAAAAHQRFPAASSPASGPLAPPTRTPERQPALQQNGTLLYRATCVTCDNSTLYSGYTFYQTNSMCSANIPQHSTSGVEGMCQVLRSQVFSWRD